MANDFFRLCIKGPFEAVAAGLRRLARMIEAPHKYRPERHYMRGSGPKSRARLGDFSRPD
ncbi:MAG: hypothetical protein GC182_23720 [Rhodopseudomonas sp.]|nr:hypothetical protein [Rhodopseudomonas sp.]